MARAPGNPNTQGPFGNTLLHLAVATGDRGEVERLLAAGADPAIVNREGQTALRVAAILGLDEALRETFPASDPVAVTPPGARR
jgi:ankyrin repeat protein